MFGLSLKLHFEMESSIPSKHMQNSIFFFYVSSFHCSPRVKPGNLCGKTTTQAYCNPELWKLSMIPNRSAKTISAQESKLRSLKTGLIFPGLSSLKTYRYAVHIYIYIYFFFFFFFFFFSNISSKYTG